MTNLFIKIVIFRILFFRATILGCYRYACNRDSGILETTQPDGIEKLSKLSNLFLYCCNNLSVLYKGNIKGQCATKEYQGGISRDNVQQNKKGIKTYKYHPKKIKSTKQNVMESLISYVT
jgi:hypothetical protein